MVNKALQGVVLCYNRTGSIMLLLPKLFQFGHVSQTCVIFLYFLHELKSTYPRCAICATVPHVYQTWCNLRKMERVSQVLNEWGDVPQCVTTSSYDQARKNKKHEWCGASNGINSTQHYTTDSGFPRCAICATLAIFPKRLPDVYQT